MLYANVLVNFWKNHIRLKNVRFISLVTIEDCCNHGNQRMFFTLEQKRPKGVGLRCKGSVEIKKSNELKSGE
jgi:hypothetical protein